jgi:phosphoribosyl 1,2-cyclic phosphate phosphodiesterase
VSEIASTGPRTFTFLGTGTSVGVPMLGCECAVCKSANPRNHRYRCSVVIGTPRGNILIDTTPEMRLQLLRAKVRLVHAVLYTHYHVDHLFGMDDLRVFPLATKAALPIYCTDEVEEVIRRSFPYVFDARTQEITYSLVPKLEFRRIAEAPFEALGETVTPIPLLHNQFNVLGFRIDDVAYCTDVSVIPERSWPLLHGLKVLVIDALRPGKPHPAHFSLDQALEVVDRLKPERAYLTHMAHSMEYESLMRSLPAGVEPAYDGLSFEF